MLTSNIFQTAGELEHCGVPPDQHHHLRRGAHRVQDLRPVRGLGQRADLHPRVRNRLQHLRPHPRRALPGLRLPLRQVQRGEHGGPVPQESQAVLHTVRGQDLQAQEPHLAGARQEDLRESQGDQS